MMAGIDFAPIPAQRAAQQCTGLRERPAAPRRRWRSDTVLCAASSQVMPADRGPLQPALSASQLQGPPQPARARQRPPRHRRGALHAPMQPGDLGADQPEQQALPTRSNHRAQRGPPPQHAPDSPTQQHKRTRDPMLLTHLIRTSTSLLELQSMLHRDAQWLNAAHISAVLQKAVQFADSDPAIWFRPPTEAAIALRHPRRRPVVTPAPPPPAPESQSEDDGSDDDAVWRASYDDGTDSNQQSDWGMSDEEYPGPSGRYPDYPPPLDPASRMAATRQLLGAIHKTAVLAGQLAGKQQLDHNSASRILWALSSLGYNNEPVLRQVLVGCPVCMPCATSRSLTRMLKACALLKLRPGVAWLAAWESSMLACMPSVTSQEVCTSVYALGLLGHRPSTSFLSAACARTQQLLPSCRRPRDLANLCAGIAAAQHMPDEAWIATFLSASAPLLSQFQLKDLHRTLSSLASLDCKPNPEWLADFYARCQHVVSTPPTSAAGRLTTKQMASMTGGLARLGCRPDMRWMDVCLLHTRYDFPYAKAQDLARLGAALAVLRYRPSESWMQVYLTACFQHLGTYGPEQVVSQLQSLVRLGHRPSPIWLNELTRKVQTRLHEFTGDQLGSLLGSLARLQYRPRHDWLSAWEAASQGSLDHFSADALASSVWGMAELQHQPAVSWLYSFVLAAYSKLDAFGSGQLGMVFEALPRVSPHPGWLDELVQICASESSPGTGRGLSSSSSYDELEDVDMTITPGPTLDDGSIAAGGVGAVPMRRQGSGTGGLWYQIPSVRAGGAESVAAPMRIYGRGGTEEVVAAPAPTGARAPRTDGAAVRANGNGRLNGDGSGRGVNGDSSGRGGQQQQGDGEDGGEAVVVAGRAGAGGVNGRSNGRRDDAGDGQVVAMVGSLAQPAVAGAGDVDIPSSSGVRIQGMQVAGLMDGPEVLGSRQQGYPAAVSDGGAVRRRGRGEAQEVRQGQRDGSSQAAYLQPVSVAG